MVKPILSRSTTESPLMHIFTMFSTSVMLLHLILKKDFRWASMGKSS